MISNLTIKDFIFYPELQGGYYSIHSHFHCKSYGQLVYNYDDNGRMFFNKVIIKKLKYL